MDTEARKRARGSSPSLDRQQPEEQSTQTKAARSESDSARQKRLEKNRRSAQRHRVKIKHESEALRADKAKLTQDNTALQWRLAQQAAQIQRLEAQVDTLQAALRACSAPPTASTPTRALTCAQVPGPQCASAPPLSPPLACESPHMLRLDSASTAAGSHQSDPVNKLDRQAGDASHACERRSTDSQRVCAALMQLGLPPDAPRLHCTAARSQVVG